MDYFTETEQSNIINDMKTHIETAKTNKLVFYNKSLRLFITPEELESAQKEGKYMQPADDWLLFHITPPDIMCAYRAARTHLSYRNFVSWQG